MELTPQNTGYEDELIDLDATLENFIVAIDLEADLKPDLAIELPQISAAKSKLLGKLNRRLRGGDTVV